MNADLATAIHQEIADNHAGWDGRTERAFDKVDWKPVSGFEPCEHCGNRVSLWRHTSGTLQFFHVGRIRPNGSCRLHGHTPAQCRKRRQDTRATPDRTTEETP